MKQQARFSKRSGLAYKVAKLRLYYHAYMLDVCDILNQLGIYSDEKHEERAAHHSIAALFDCMPRLTGWTDEQICEAFKKINHLEEES